jgi:hypothetical protein
VIFILFVILTIGLSVIVIKLVGDALKRKSLYYGFQFTSVKCPKCEETVPYLRTPSSMKQELWGGWTCKRCGTEMDKFGTDVGTAVRVEDPSVHRTRADLINPFDSKGMTPIERVINDKN